MGGNLQGLKLELVLFMLLLFSGSYFYYSIDYDNTASRFYLVSAIVDFGMLNIDPYASRTIDKSFNNGHFYSNKAIGSPLVAVPIYWLQRQVEPWKNQPPLRPFMRYVIRLFTTTIPFAFLGVVLFRLSRLWGVENRRALLMVFAYVFGSIAIIHSSMFSGHEMAAAFSFFSFTAVYKLRQEELNTFSQNQSDSESSVFPEPENSLRHSENMLTSKSILAGFGGLSAGIGALCDPTAMYIAGVLSCYTLFSRIALRYKIIFMSFGMVCAAVLAVYNWHCFGSPISSSYHHLTFQEFAEPGKEGLVGITFPKLGPLISILFSPARGLFAIMPIFVFSILGIWKMSQDKNLRREAWVISVIVIGYLMINSGFYGWHGGWAYGPRYLIPMLPFLAIPMIFAPREPLLFGLALFFSVIQITLVAISIPHTSIEIINPLTELVIPLMFEGYLAESWPMWLGLSSAAAMMFYFFICGILVCFLWRGARKEDGDKTGLISFGLQKGEKKKGVGFQLREDLRDIRNSVTIRNWRVALPIVGWLLIIAFMLNTFHTVPVQTVQYYHDRLLYTLGARDVIHDQVETLAEEYQKSRLRTKSQDEEESQRIDNKRDPF